jgi:hypothetical protein
LPICSFPGHAETDVRSSTSTVFSRRTPDPNM